MPSASKSNSSLLALPLGASAATINVNSTADTLVAGDGKCTLREAVINANGDSDTTGGDCAAGSGANLINVPAGTYVIGSYLHIQSDLTVRGEDARVVEINLDGSGALVWIGSGPWAVALERLTLTGPGEIAGGRGWGAGVLAENESGNLTISESVVYGNYGEWGPGCCTLIDARGVFSASCRGNDERWRRLSRKVSKAPPAIRSCPLSRGSRSHFQSQPQRSVLSQGLRDQI